MAASLNYTDSSPPIHSGPASRFSPFAVVHVRLRTDIVTLYGLFVLVTEHISFQLWTLAARQCVALFLRDRSPPQFRRFPGLKPYRRLIQDATGTAGVEFIAENGGGPGVRLQKARHAATKPNG